MTKKAKQMIVILMAVIGLVWTISFVVEYVAIPTGKAIVTKIDKGIAIDACRYNRNPNVESFQSCMDRMGY